MNLEIVPVQTQHERRIFLTFPWRIYRRAGNRDPLWVPPLIPERARLIDPARGPFFKRGEAEFFIAWRDGRPVGTICLGEDKAINAISHVSEGIFGFFDCIQDYQVAAAMLNFAAQWARRHKLDTLVGPFHLDREDAYGILIEGRDRPPALLCGHTPPYYQEFVERYGLRPARADNLAFAVDIVADTPELQRLSRLADELRKRGHIFVRGADMAHWQEDAERVYAIINRALSHLPDFVPWRRDEFQALLEPFLQIADPELILFAEIEGQVVGWFPGLPNLYEAFYRVNGLRYPWNYINLWWQLRRRPQCLTVKSVLVLPEYWDTGVSVLLFDEMLKRARVKGYTWIDLSLTSDDNPYTPTLARRMGAKLYKRYRVYRLDMAK